MTSAAPAGTTWPAATDPRSRDALAAAAAGGIFVVLSVLGIATVKHSPAAHAAPADVLRYFRLQRTQILRTTILLSLANGALLIFFAYLRTLLAERSSSERSAPATLPTLALVASGVLCAIGAATAALPAALAHYGTTGIDPMTTVLVREIYFTGNAFSAMPAALAVVSIGLAARTAPALPTWLAPLSFIIGALELTASLTLIGSGAAAPDGALGTSALFGSLTMWVLVVSVSLTARYRRTAEGSKSGLAASETPSVPCEGPFPGVSPQGRTMRLGRPRPAIELAFVSTFCLYAVAPLCTLLPSFPWGLV